MENLLAHHQPFGLWQIYRLQWISSRAIAGSCRLAVVFATLRYSNSLAGRPDKRRTLPKRRFASSDVLAWPRSQKPSHAKQNRPSQSQAMSLAYLGLWPWLEILKARGHGLSHGFGLNFWVS
jgi:hypothetical protein